MKISSQWRKPLSVDLLKQHCTSVVNCKQAHAVLLRFDLLHENILSSKLLSFLALSSSGDLKYAHQLFDQLSSPDSFIWNTIIRGHARSPKPSQAISFFLQMVSSGVTPDHHSYPFVLTACTRMLSPELGMRFHAEAFKFGLESDVFVLNSLIQMYACCGLFDDARKLFDGNPIRDVVSWNAMIRGYVKRREFEQAFGCFDDMIQENMQPDSVTMISLASACSQMGDLDRGRCLHSYSCELGLVASNLQLGNAILDMYCKCGDLCSANNLFDEMDERDLLTWTSMISGFTTLGNFHEALELFSQMQNERIHPDEMVLGTMLSVCAQMGALDEGKYVHRLIEKYNVKRDVVLQTSLIDMYAKCGRVDFAMQVFKKMKERNVFTWNAMIGGLAIHGHGHLALDLFEEMKHEEEAVADDVTFIGLLLACSHSGLVKAGLKIFNEMEDVYQIHPRMEHYGCVVDLLCRAGLVQDALDFMEKMPVKPNEVLWASLIGACRVLGKTNIAEMLSRNMIELDPESCGRYVILSNLYAGVSRWDDALRVRNLMRAKGIDKTPGLSWIELNGIVHQFVAGDRSHVQTEDIYMMVTEMCQRARLAGHMSGTSEVLFDIEEEEKEHSLFFHSEKLAVAFGLMSTAPGSNIRITKNLRVCHDCHSFLKAISKVFNREIVARDRSRFHYFSGGLCSCKDFW